MKGNPQLYHVFYMVAQHKSMTRAAKKLYLSQPAISKAMKSLEAQLETKLFERKSHGITLTEEGHMLYGYVSKAMKALHAGEKTLEERRLSKNALIKVGASTSMCKFFLFQHLQAFQSLYPNISIQVINHSTKEVFDSLRNGTIDIGINCFCSDASTYERVKLFDIHDIFIVHRDYMSKFHHLPVTPETLGEHPLFLLHGESIGRLSINHYFQSRDMQIVPHIESENMDFIIECARSGTGVACAIREFVEEELQDGTLVEIPLASPPPVREAGIIYDGGFRGHVGLFVDYLRGKG